MVCIIIIIDLLINLITLFFFCLISFYIVPYVKVVPSRAVKENFRCRLNASGWSALVAKAFYFRQSRFFGVVFIFF